MAARIGVYNLDTEGGGGQRRAVLMAQRLSRRYHVTLFVGHSCAKSSLESYFGADLTGVDLYCIRTPVQQAVRGALRSRRIDWVFQSLHRDLDATYFRQIEKLGLDVFINTAFGSNIRCPGRRGIYMCMFPHAMSGQARPCFGTAHGLYDRIVSTMSRMTPEVLDSYNLITANSAFTARWIAKRWKRPASVVYSAPADMGPPGEKLKTILHVGRFVSGNRPDYKHQLTLLETFRDLRQLRDAGWSMHFAGAVNQDAASRLTLMELERAARGLPVQIHKDIAFEPLRSLYRNASLYWHATGYGTDPEKHPLWQEHFGLTTLEAMSAGAVPLVIDSGGQRETVNHGVDGFRWTSLHELQEHTFRLAADTASLTEFSDRAVASSKRFGAAAFAERVEQMVEAILADRTGKIQERTTSP